ncbi:contactin-2-like isoform X2 [Acanthaster planci]|uniref:Contactin-2-like isoform X2 n=1 Tax=Acanthaster planci TaxID=133434 RepID=A0A8B7YTU6_ACAPL|nr:contactin-2-like isoform X2 [Acanthaster planci]
MAHLWVQSSRPPAVVFSFPVVHRRGNMRQLLLLLVAVIGCSAQEYTGLEGTGPHMVKQPLDTVFNEDSNIESVYLDCEADGNERPTYTWQRNGEVIDTGAEIRFQLSGGRLTIEQPDRVMDAGTYQCFPSNQIGTIMSRKAKLEFAYLNYFPEVGPADITIPLNSGQCISCEVPEHYPGVEVIWYNDPFPVVSSLRTHTTIDGRLCFAYFKESDVGTYKCFARNSIDTGGGSSANKFSDTFAVTAGPATGAAEFGPTVAIAVEDQEVLVNTEEVTLSCFFFGNPAPSIQWRRKTPAGAGLPTLYELKSSNQILVLKNIQVDDAGEYECYTEEGDGRSSGNVVVRVPPTWVQEIADMEGNIYGDATWECEAESPDGVNYKWYRNAEEIVNLPRHQLSNGLKTLTITNLTVEDTGMYQCAASNDYGIIYTTGQLTVLAMKPWFETELEQDQPAPREGSVTIICQPKAAPTPTIQWTKGSQILSSNGHYIILDNGNLMIVDVVDSDAGEYTCTATNSIGSSSSTGSIVVKDGTKITQGPTDLVINEGEMGTLTCQASYDPYFELRYIWLKDGIQVNTQSASYEQPDIGTGEVSQLHIKDASMDLGGEYSCQAITIIDEASASAMVTIRGRPGPPAGISVVVSGLAANVSWSHGADNNSPIESYIIEGSTNHVPEFTVLRSGIPAASRHIRLTGLSAWSRYRFRVIAVNAVGQGQPSEESDEQETAQDRPVEPPANVDGGGGSDGDLRITWEPLPMQKWNAPGLTYIVYWRQKDSGLEFQEQEVNDSSVGEFVTSGVPAYTPFDVQVQAKNVRGEGPKSPLAEVYSFQRSPDEAPTNVAADPVSATSIQVSWTGINEEQIVGVLEGYMIKYWTEDSTQELAENIRSPGSGTEATIEGLEPNTVYNILVSAYSGAGSGPPNSEPVQVTTLKSAPQQAPTGVKVTPKGSNSVTVKWNSITTSANEEPLSGYKVLYWPQGDFEDDAAIEKVNKNTNQITIDGLKLGTTYYIKVKGYSKGGDGVASSPPQSIDIGAAGEQSPRGGKATHITASTLLVFLPLLVAFHLH